MQFLLGYETICRVKMTLIGLMENEKYLREILPSLNERWGNSDSCRRQVVVILYPGHNIGNLRF